MSAEEAATALAFTPHARGSTALEEFEAGGCVVYPACAGIDPSKA